jgi:aryl-alcohol dehydrogenase-like predicted oxidoreductase
MDYRKLGNTDIKVSEIGFGALGIGSVFYGKKDRAESLRAIDRAIDLGINFFDTCPGYGDSEEILGQAFKGRRDKVVISTKIKTAGFDNIAQSVEHSLGRLQTDYLDVLQLRDPTPEKVANLAVLEDMVKLKAQGKIRLGSVTVGDGRQTEQALYAIEAGFDSIQLAYNMVFRNAAESALPCAESAGVGVLVRGSLCKGFLTTRLHSIPDENRAKGSFSQFTIEEAETLIKIQKELSFLILPGRRSLAQAAIQFALKPGAVSTVIPSMDQVGEVEDLFGALAAPQITDSEIEAAIAVIENNAAVAY